MPKVLQTLGLIFFLWKQNSKKASVGGKVVNPKLKKNSDFELFL